MASGTHTARITFHGGAGSVTGANFLFETGTQKLLIDCGLIQSNDFCDAINWSDFPYNPADIDVLFVTHGHTDHIGRIPRLVAQGFRGRIYSTPPTKDIARLMLEDALRVMKDELAKRENPRQPLYTESDIESALAIWDTFEYHEKISLNDASAQFLDAGHILGSAMIELIRGDKTIVFTGDLGNDHIAIARKTEEITDVNYLVMESVYGDRNHEGSEVRRQMLRNAIDFTREHKGVLLVPAFSLERTQVLLYEINELIAAGMQPIPVFLDAPLAIRLMDVYQKYPEYLNDEVRERIAHDDPFSFKGLTLTPSMEDSRAIYDAPNPKVIIAGSGMSHGGRIRGHEKQFLGDKKTTILFPGYQSVGSLGRRLAEGATKVNIDGEWVHVHARTAQLHGYSAHKDRDGLIAFVELTAKTLERVFVVMGEPRSALFLTQRLRDFLDVDAIAPDAGESFTLAW
ncbi:MBL fold metallo-hydrolase [Candidatus Kaiserbacteria bacterium]|nr:MBL fold metallo-hydrolase [Candidatus Kaiserbacteria bacterium]